MASLEKGKQPEQLESGLELLPRPWRHWYSQLGLSVLLNINNLTKHQHQT